MMSSNEDIQQDKKRNVKPTNELNYQNSPELLRKPQEETRSSLYLTDYNSQLFSFGDFTTEDHGKYFTEKTVQQHGVEFICDFYNASKDWVEDCHNQVFVDFVDLDIECNTQETEVNKSEISTDLYDKPAFESNDLKEEEKEPFILENNNNATTEVKTPSWASLFKDGSSSVNENKTELITTCNNNKTTKNVDIFSVQMEEVKVKIESILTPSNLNLSLIDVENDQRALNMAEYLVSLTPNFLPHHLQVRGLVNRGNWCYVNTVLQALHSISPMSHFYKSLNRFLNKTRTTSTPVTDCMIAFFNEFECINPKIPLKKQSNDLRAGAPFEPRCVYDVLPVAKTTLSEKGRQEDAEEFLSFLLNGIHDELVMLFKLNQKTVNDDESGAMAVTQLHSSEADEISGGEDSWEHVGKKNKTSTLRKAVIAESFIKDLFGGVIRSSVHQTGAKESTTLQPFFTLQLDIQSAKIVSLKDAIEYYFVKENLQGFTCSKTNTEVEASRRSSLEELPPIFIFHLKYFVFDRQGGSQKLHKHIDIPVDLEIPKDVLSPNIKTQPSILRHYKLYTVIYHHGKNSAGGHYTAAVHHGHPFGWINFDDNVLKAVNVNQVLKYHQGCVPYILFYERISTV